MKASRIDWLIVAGIGLALLTPTQSKAQETQSSTKTILLSVLGGRLSAEFPAEAKASPRGHSVMEAAQSEEEETRILVDNGTQRFVVLFQELFEKAGADFEQTAHVTPQEFSPENGRITMSKATIRNPNLTGICFLPEKNDVNATAVFLEGVMVKNRDGFVEIVRFYVNPEGAKYLPAYQQSVERIIASLEPGMRRIESKARTVSIGEQVDRKLWLDLPADYLLTTQQGPDFTVYHIRKVGILGQTTGNLGFYVGTAPQGIETAKAVGGTLFGKPVQWQQMPVRQGDLHLRQEVSVVYPKSGRLRLHVFISGVSAMECQQMRRIAETLRLTEAKK